MIYRFGTRVREIVRVLRGLPPDDAVRQRTIALNEQVVRLREARIAHEKQREEAALKEVQFVVEEMARLKESLIAAEEAAVEFVNQIGDQAQAQLEDDWNKEAETLISKVMTQKNLVAGAPLDLGPVQSVTKEASQESLLVSSSPPTAPSKT